MLELIAVGAWSCLVAYSAWFFSSAKERERAHRHLEELVEERTRCLRESQTKLKNIFASCPDAITVTDLNGNIIECNQTTLDLYGWSSKEELVGKSGFEFVARKDHQRAIEDWKKTLERGSVRNIEYTFLTKDGREFPAEFSASVIKDPSGNPTGFVTIIKDITERKKAERDVQEAHEYAESIVATVREPLVVLDKDLKVIMANRSFYLTFKTKPENTEGQLLYELGNRQWDIPQLRQLLEEILPKNATFSDFEVEHHFSTIGHKVILLNARRIYTETNETQMILLAIEDITERKRMEQQLLKSERLAAIGQLASVVGHEIRNPLGVINNSSYFLNSKLKDIADEKVMKHLKIIERKVNSANLIVSDLLDFARKKTPTLEQTELNDIVTSALSSILILENIKVTTKLDEIPPMLLDREQIQRVCQNIILNAIQAMPESGKLTIQTSKHEDSAEITFKDTGVGIPEENLPKLFTPLFSTKAKGMGLGLTICKQTVEGHGGNITVKSKVGEGSTFTVELPIRAKEEAKSGK